MFSMFLCAPPSVGERVETGLGALGLARRCELRADVSRSPGCIRVVLGELGHLVALRSPGLLAHSTGAQARVKDFFIPGAKGWGTSPSPRQFIPIWNELPPVERRTVRRSAQLSQKTR
jgi:hypothetical protein